jgi:hypothetical protein
MPAASVPPVPAAPAPEAGASSALPALELLQEFEERYRREAGDVRTLSCQMQELLAVTEKILDELDQRSWWQRLWQWLIGYSAALEQRQNRTQMRMQQMSVLMTAAIARQNRIVIEGLRVALEKLQRIEDDTRQLHTAVQRIENRSLLRRTGWEPLLWPLRRAWAWLTQAVHRSSFINRGP